MKTPAIFYHPDAVEGMGKELVGRRSAGQSFLRGFIDHVPDETLHAVTQHQGTANSFSDLLQDLGVSRQVNIKTLRGPSDFTSQETIFFPGSDFLNANWRRQHFGPKRCSLVGVTHTMSTRRVISDVHKLMLEPVEEWDAIICTSRAVQSVVARQFELEVEFIRQRFGGTRVPLPQLPVIPLGIVASDFEQFPNDRTDIRERFSAPEDAIVVMTMGRIASVEKANPVPLFLALEEVAQTTKKTVHLWLVGWSNNDEELAMHKAGARTLAPSVKVTLIDGRDADVRRHIWAGADIFTLPVDNIQETFGLVPVEAMAAGLPVVMPDWNGFRDTVVHGETGFLIPTRMSPAGTEGGARLAARFADGTDTYLKYLSLIQQQTQIDVRAYVAAFKSLVLDDSLRKRMADAGKRHIRAQFDWAAVIPQYLALAEELAQRRKLALTTSPKLASGPLNPIEVDPFDLYQRYPSTSLHLTDLLHSRKPLGDIELASLDRLNGRQMYGRKAMPDERYIMISELLVSYGPLTLAGLIRRANLSTESVVAAVLFLAKYDYVMVDALE